MLMNAGLGNRAPLKDGRKLRVCPLCNSKLNEVHLLIECEPLEPLRKVLGIRNFIGNQGVNSSVAIYQEYWNVWKISAETRNKRAHAAQKLLDGFLESID